MTSDSLPQVAEEPIVQPIQSSNPFSVDYKATLDKIKAQNAAAAATNTNAQPETPADPFAGKTNEELAAEVWAGKYGSGQARREALGSRYAAVQALVNKGVSSPTGVKPVTNVVKAESADTSSVQKEVPVSSESEQINLRPSVDSVNIPNENPKTPRYDGSGYADFVPAAKFNYRYARGN